MGTEGKIASQEIFPIILFWGTAKKEVKYYIWGTDLLLEL